MSLSDIVSAGKDLGYSGETLSKFIADQQEKEEYRKQKEEERKQKDFERVERAAQRELQKLDKELELELARKANKEDKSAKINRAKPPKLPHFNDQQDDIDAYLERFERYATTQEWRQQDWATNLSALLGGKALDVYYRLDSEAATNYIKLKEALLRRYNLTKEGFCDRFYTSKADPGESPQQFLARLNCYLEKWRTLADMKKTYDDLHNMFLHEHFIKACHPSLATYLRERKIQNLEELTRYTQTYLDAHGGNISSTRKETPKEATEKKVTTSHFPRQTSPVSERTCYRCFQKGHIARDCSQREPTLHREAKQQKTFVKYENRTCFKCGKEGHMAKDCKGKQPRTPMASLTDADDVSEDENLRPKSQSYDRQPSCSIHHCKCADIPTCSALLLGDYTLDSMDIQPSCSSLNIHVTDGVVNQMQQKQ